MTTERIYHRGGPYFHRATLRAILAQVRQYPGQEHRVETAQWLLDRTDPNSTVIFDQPATKARRETIDNWTGQLERAYHGPDHGPGDRARRQRILQRLEAIHWAANTNTYTPPSGVGEPPADGSLADGTYTPPPPDLHPDEDITTPT